MKRNVVSGKNKGYITIDQKIINLFIRMEKKIASNTCTLTHFKSCTKILTAYSIISSVAVQAIMITDLVT